jgi:hypothetical protein
MRFIKVVPHLQKRLTQKFGYNPYDLRIAISSKCIAEGDVEKIKKLETYQGHSLKLIFDYYNVYSKSS